MRNGKLIAGLALGGVVIVTIGSFAAYRWVKHAFGTAGSAPPATESVPVKKEAASAPSAPPLSS